jgi:hypothetical protein
MAPTKQPPKEPPPLDEVIYPDRVKELFARAIVDGRLAASEESVAAFMNSYARYRVLGEEIFRREPQRVRWFIDRGKPQHGAL